MNVIFKIKKLKVGRKYTRMEKKLVSVIKINIRKRIIKKIISK